jgi:hypothetical protein
MNIQDCCGFKKMFTPIVIQILFWIGVVLTTVIGLISIIGGLASHYGGGGAVLGGLIMLLVGPIIVRVQCELIIVIFRILDVLTDIRDGKSGGATTTTTTSVPPASTPGM